MLYRGIIATDLSGRLDGIVWSHNRGGPYARNATNPTQPNTPEQDACRTAMANSKTAWDALTPSQRLAWASYSRGAPRSNRIGIARPTGAYPEFTRANVPRLQCNAWLATSLPVVEDPPSAASDTNFGPLTLAIQNQATGEILVTWDAAQQGWQPEAGAALLLWIGENRPLTVNFYAGPYTLVGAAEGDNGLSDFTIFAPAAQLPLPNDRHIFWRARTTRADGRLGNPQHGVLVT